MQPYTDVRGRAWELTPIPANSDFAGGHVVGYLCWVKSAVPASHPGDYARAGHGMGRIRLFLKPLGMQSLLGRLMLIPTPDRDIGSVLEIADRAARQ